MTLQLKRRIMLIVHDVFIHPIIGIGKALSFSTKDGWAGWLHDVTLPSLPECDKGDKEIRRKRMTRFEIFKGANEDWYWRLKAANGEIIAVSEGYESKQMAMHGIDSVKENAPIAQILIENEENDD